MRPRQVGSPPAVDKHASLESSSEDRKSVLRIVGGSPTVDESAKTPDSEKGEEGKPRQFKVPWPPSVQFSSPLPGAPKVGWRRGSNPKIIIEMWPDGEAQPSQRYLAFLLGDFKRIVIYHRDRRNIRDVFNLGELKADGRQGIIGGRVEWDGLITKKELREAAILLEEFARIDGRGRPGGTRRPQRKPHEMAGLNANGYLRLERWGLTKQQIRVLTLASRISQVKIARQLGISAPAVRRLLERAEKNLQKKNPDFSLTKLKRAPEEVGSGQRWSNRPVEKDESGTPYVRDLSQQVEHPTWGRTGKRGSRK